MYSCCVFPVRWLLCRAENKCGSDASPCPPQTNATRTLWERPIERIRRANVNFPPPAHMDAKTNVFFWKLEKNKNLIRFKLFLLLNYYYYLNFCCFHYFNQFSIQCFIIIRIIFNINLYIQKIFILIKFYIKISYAMRIGMKKRQATAPLDVRISGDDDVVFARFVQLTQRWACCTSGTNEPGVAFVLLININILQHKS